MVYQPPLTHSIYHIFLQIFSSLPPGFTFSPTTLFFLIPTSFCHLWILIDKNRMAHSQPLKQQLGLAFLLRRHIGMSQNASFCDESASQLPGIWHDWITLCVCFDPKASFTKTGSFLPLPPSPSCFLRCLSVHHLCRCMSARVAFSPPGTLTLVLLASPVGTGSRGTEQLATSGTAALQASSAALPSRCRLWITLNGVHRSYPHPARRKQSQTSLKQPERVL